MADITGLVFNPTTFYADIKIMEAMEPQLYVGLNPYLKKLYVRDYSSTHKGREQLIIDTVYRHFGVEPERYNSRKVLYCLPRQVSMYFIRLRSPMSSTDVGKLFGGKDHSTVLNAANTIIDLISVDKKLMERIKEIERILDEQ